MSATAQPAPWSGDCGFDLNPEERLDRSFAGHGTTLRLGCVGDGIADRRSRRIEVRGDLAAPGGIQIP
jgi:hypothetical protein